MTHPRRAVLVALARAANAAFFVVTATYCILTYSSFAYQNFIRPRLVASLAGFVALHHLWYWIFLATTLLTFLPEWRTMRGRVLAWGYFGAAFAVGLLMIVRPVLPSVENDSLGLWLAFAFLLPPVWLAVYDHVATADGFRVNPLYVRSLVPTAALSGAVIWIVNTVTVPLRFSELGDFTTTRGGLLFGAGVSLAVHLAVFVTAAVGLASLLSVAARLRRCGLRRREAALALLERGGRRGQAGRVDRGRRRRAAGGEEQHEDHAAWHGYLLCCEEAKSERPIAAASSGTLSQASDV